MKRWLVLLVPLAAAVVFLTRNITGAVAAAVQGVHVASGNAGYLGLGSFGADGVGTGSNTGVGGSSATGTGVFGLSSSSSALSGIGVQGFCSVCTGVDGISDTGYGVFGQTGGTYPAATANGVTGYAGNGGIGLYAYSTAAGWAGLFSGNVDVIGTLYKSSGGFRIDHPTDPMNKFLNHSFVESPDMKNMYDGVTTLDRRGEAVIELPAWFDALNGDFRYQLTCIGENAPVYIADEVKDNHFRISGGYEGMRVSWQVTGTRQDPYAEMHRIPIEELKPPELRGKLLHPDAYRMPESQGINYVRERVLREMALHGGQRFR